MARHGMRTHGGGRYLRANKSFDFEDRYNPGEGPPTKVSLLSVILARSFHSYSFFFWMIALFLFFVELGEWMDGGGGGGE